ncbi:MAG: hypothetical protein J6A82_01280 [Coprococcus sp.]|nr:hypothetical protein [Coprococcus sp.]
MKRSNNRKKTTNNVVLRQKLKFYVYTILTCFVVFWCGKIHSVNVSQRSRDSVYEKNDVVTYDGLRIIEKEAHIYEHVLFEQRFCIDVNHVESGRVLCVCLEVKNISSQDLTWDYIFGVLECGFQTDTWASVVSPFIGQKLNIVPSDGLKKSDSCMLWFATTMLPVSFKQSTWDNIWDEDFYYVLSITPEKRMIKLDIQKEK